MYSYGEERIHGFEINRNPLVGCPGNASHNSVRSCWCMYLDHIRVAIKVAGCLSWQGWLYGILDYWKFLASLVAYECRYTEVGVSIRDENVSAAKFILCSIWDACMRADDSLNVKPGKYVNNLDQFWLLAIQTSLTQLDISPRSKESGKCIFEQDDWLSYR